jgi:hypothetical protein
MDLAYLNSRTRDHLIQDPILEFAYISSGEARDCLIQDLWYSGFRNLESAYINFGVCYIAIDFGGNLKQSSI